MEITSFQFAGFVLLTLVVYYLLPRRPQNVLLLVASYLFYASWSWWYLLALWAMTAVNYAVGLNLRGRSRRGVLALGIGVNLLALAVFKYEDFFVPDLLARLDKWGVETGVGGVEILLPVGMSFYVVAVLSYLLDVYRGQAQPAEDLVDFALYLAYFPKLIAGPIERARAFMPRLTRQRIVDNDVLARSFSLIVIGLVRKVVLADTMFKMRPEGMFSDPEKFGALKLGVYLVVYAFALYNDFAGYTSIVRGVSGLFGIELSHNFNVPYFSRNFSEFWNRWHITLSHWLRDYIYFPTSRALLRRNPTRTNIPNLLIPPMATMLASGLWHGPGWSMLVWGALHGVFLIGERLLALWRPAGPPQKQPRWRQGIAMGIVFTLVMLAWVPFVVPTPSGAVDFWRGLLNFSDLSRPSVRILIALCPALWLDWVQYRGGDELVFLRWPRLAQATLLAVAFMAIFLISQADTGAPFVYQGF